MSTLNSAMGAALTGLFSQSSYIANVSTNLANIGTTAYKKSDVSFSSLVSGRSGSPYGTNAIGNGVRSHYVPRMNAQGIISGTNRSTDMAIDGKGFFVTSKNGLGKDFSFTRDGSFFPNEKGLLVNANGRYLMGLPTDNQGKISGSFGSLSSLKPIDLSKIGGSASPTTSLAMKANLPAQAKVGDKFNRDIEVYDSLGTAHVVKTKWEKTAANTWKLTYDNPRKAGDTAGTSGTAAGTVTLNFDTAGKLTSTTPNPPKLTVTGWTTGAKNSDITLNLGDVTQLSGSGAAELSVKSVTQDGSKFGKLRSVSVSASGHVIAAFDNGTSYPVFKVPIASFTNPSGLKAAGGNSFTQTLNSGSYTLHAAGNGGSGKIVGSALEKSNVDTAEQMTKLIVAQQAYSASAEIISTTNKLHETLIRAKR